MITREQIEADIASGKSTRIYTAANSLWWTHLDKDVEESTRMGLRYREEADKKFFNDPNVSQEAKRKVRSLASMIAKSRHQVPLDPTGSPLLVMDDPKKWITQALSNPNWYGKHGLAAFILTHHQNCQDYYSNKWDGYNKYIDNHSPLKIVK